ncbi:MAG: MerR family transcriptional regulator [Nitrospinota bacterium]
MGTEAEIPDKLFFKIGEVAEITGTKPHVLRYWESEFKILKPAKAESGQRVYRRKDVELIFAIKRLLYEENFTIAGAKKQLQRMRSASSRLPAVSRQEQYGKTLRQIRKELMAILDILNSK